MAVIRDVKSIGIDFIFPALCPKMTIHLVDHGVDAGVKMGLGQIGCG
jgi:hypothetical protein